MQSHSRVCLLPAEGAGPSLACVDAPNTGRRRRAGFVRRAVLARHGTFEVWTGWQYPGRARRTPCRPLDLAIGGTSSGI